MDAVSFRLKLYQVDEPSDFDNLFNDLGIITD